MAIFIDYKNFKCEDCGGDKFTILDRFKEDRNEITLNCATKDCEASYSFRPVIKLSSSSHPSHQVGSVPAPRRSVRRGRVG